MTHQLNQLHSLLSDTRQQVFDLVPDYSHEDVTTARVLNLLDQAIHHVNHRIDCTHPDFTDLVSTEHGGTHV